MTILNVNHVTVYRYAKPVGFGDHRLMFRPRDSHDMRLLETRMVISPPPKSVRWMHDVFGNSIAMVSFERKATELRFESRIRLDHFGLSNPNFPIEDHARIYPFSYSAEEVPDLGRTIERHFPDPDHKVDEWAKQFIRTDGPTETQDMLVSMTRAIKEGFTYKARTAPGTQTPIETLELGSGSCRDYTLLMMEAARTLGFAARFVSGYLYDPAVDGDPESRIGGGATHAWVQIYLPGAGWVEFDPTNGIVGGAGLIRVAVARDPAQAVPLSGDWFGEASDFLGMDVDVVVASE
ncbi:transglutaminase [Skermanella stibiiresistens SB22]|jgi:transglutaminase-like putative cysteine protease|uniref:Transglutaminase n=1 Tax=Skermanella stibiiresistens SB22 TaxID=1385369 RepID=W9GUC6_9PROT|nr:transglutaminase family protein [Skermanella stibiiresistens]EWY37505.1 transglutaminase [Skermanella stibiiresistens SB22]